MNKQQIIQTYKAARNVKISIENELVNACSVDDLINLNERNLALRRFRIDNPTVPEDNARLIINEKCVARNRRESEVTA